ncbi:MAG: branched-chain amino acid aminotransferase [Bacteroidia bacterium]
MIATEKVTVEKTKNSHLSEVNFNNLPFGSIISDHMVVSTYSNGDWGPCSVVPFGNITISPAMLALHYGQVVFEGMKAFRMKNGNVSIFRVDRHYKRFCKSMERMCIPPMSFEHFNESLKALIKLDADWVPSAEGASLYIRPFVFASEERFGVKVAEEYKFIIFTGPVGPYYSKPLRVKVEDKYRRAARGGTGSAKCAGNYGGAFYPSQLARKQGFDQVLWTDGSDKLNIEESGTMNVMFLIDDVLVTPPISDSILDGVTRDSFITLARDMGYKVEEKVISSNDLMDAFERGGLQEAFGTGTAAVIAPIQSITIKGKEYVLPTVSDNSVSAKIKQRLLDIRVGAAPDKNNWNTVIANS